MNKHLLIALSWGIDNIGSMAITPGLLHLVNKQKPDLPVHVFSHLIAEKPGYHISSAYVPTYTSNCTMHPNCFEPMFRPNQPTSRAWLAFIERWSESKLESFRKGCLTSYESASIADDMLNRLPLEIHAELKLTNPEAAAAFDQAGFVIYNSGTMINFGRLGIRNMWGYTMSNAMPLLIARALKLPYGINANSFDAIDWPATLVYERLLGDARFVYCRDSDSLRYLEQCGLMNKNMGYRPDSAFFFPGRDESWAEQFLAENGLEEKQFLAVIVRISAHTKELIAYDPTSGAIAPERQAEQMHKLKEVIEQWVATTGKKVLVCHETRDTVESAREGLWNILSEDALAQCVYLDHFWSTEQACSVLQRTRVLLSMEMHSVIMSIGLGTPVVHNPYAEAGRKKEMVRDVGLGDWLVDIDSCSGEDMLASVLDIHHNYAASEQRIQELLPGLEARANQVISEVWTNWKK
jgi:polysaccharide pyruvyl transferase WcaK-like protein